jgi:hypothetical protein
MEDLYSVLKEIGTESESKVKGELSDPPESIKAFLYNMLMPLVLNFQTEEESYHFIFQKGGSVYLYRGLHNSPDVKVSGEHAELLFLLQTQDKKRFEIDERTGKIKISTFTFKGRQGVTKLRELFL